MASSNSQSIVAQKIKALRIKNNLSKNELSERTGLPVETIESIEEGGKPSRLDHIMRIADALNCKIASILDDNPLEERVTVSFRGGDVSTGETSEAYTQLLYFLDLDEYLELQGIPLEKTGKETTQ